jgi:hypothetical protein
MKTEMTIDELERLVGAEREQSDPFWAEMDVFLDDLQAEENVRAVEEALNGWNDGFGRPLEGFESPRFLTPRQEAYRDWFWNSPDAAYVRELRGVKDEPGSDGGRYRRRFGPDPETR